MTRQREEHRPDELPVSLRAEDGMPNAVTGLGAVLQIDDSTLDRWLVEHKGRRDSVRGRNRHVPAATEPD
jgi:hypothetical protein